jgi:aconitase A
MASSPPPVAEIAGARVLAVLGDSITTDHISPAGSIKVQSPAGKYPHRARRAGLRVQLVRLAARATTR